MKDRLRSFGLAAAFGLAVAAVVLSFVPILFPLTLTLAVLAAGTGLGFLWWEERARGRSLFPSRWVQLVAKPEDQEISATALRGARAARLAAIGLAWNAVLYFILGVHSWLCFVRSFDRELEPIRRAFRVIAQEQVKPAAQPKR